MQIDFKGNTEVSACGRSGGLMRELNNLMHHAGGHPGYPMMIPSIVWGAKGGGGGGRGRLNTPGHFMQQIPGKA